METQKFAIHWLVDQAEIRQWMQKESERMGNWLNSFVITWSFIGDEGIYRLELHSETNFDLVLRAQAEGHLNKCLFGMILPIAYIKDDTSECLPTIRAEGNAIYYALRKDFKVIRSLGRTPSSRRSRERASTLRKSSRKSSV